MTTTRQKHRDAREDLALVLRNRSNAFAVHYACESFAMPSPRIIAIAARNFGTNATRSFSIDQISTGLGISLAEASAKQLDQVERKLLDEFSGFVRQHQGHHWVHWNMRDAKFGFEALENRHRALKGKPVEVAPALRFDLSSRLFDIYGDRHTPRNESRLRFLASKNKITLTDFAEGELLADMVAAGEYVGVHRSTLRKVDVILEVADKVERKSLKTSAPILDPYGGWTGAAHFVQDHPLYLIGLICTAILGFIGAIAGLFG